MEDVHFPPQHLSYGTPSQIILKTEAVATCTFEAKLKTFLFKKIFPLGFFLLILCFNCLYEYIN